MDQELLDLLGRISELSADELSDLEGRLVTEFDRLDKEPKTPATVAAMGEIAQGVDTVRTENGARLEATAAAEATAADLRSRVHASAEGDEEVAPDEEAPAEDAPTEDAPAEVPADAPVVDKPVVEAKVAASTKSRVAFSRPSLGAAASKRPGAGVPTKRSTLNTESARTRVLARRNAEGIAAGDEITDRSQLVSLTHDAIRRLIGSNGSGEQVLVASLQVEYPEDRRLGTDMDENTRKIDSVTSLGALVASGGICNPVNVDYGVPIFSVNDEPILDSLPKFAATRGGLRFVTPPTIASVGAAGTSLWTEVVDAAPGGAVKPSQRIVCAQEMEVYVDAIPTRIVIGNMMGRFSPEITDANLKLAEVNAAQVRELNRLRVISSKSIAVSTGQLLGAARDVLATLDQAAAAYRWRNRMGHNFPLRALIPSWAVDLFRADLTREIGHGNDTSTAMSLSDADVTALLSVRNVQVTWILDGLAGGGTTGFGYQGFGAQVAGALNDWPNTLVWHLFAEGTFQLLDGGKLDIGVVRDSTLNNTNDYEVFTEVFEGVAFRGIESLQLATKVRPNGLSAGTISTAAY